MERRCTAAFKASCSRAAADTAALLLSLHTPVPHCSLAGAAKGAAGAAYDTATGAAGAAADVAKGAAGGRRGCVFMQRPGLAPLAS